MVADTTTIAGAPLASSSLNGPANSKWHVNRGKLDSSVEGKSAKNTSRNTKAGVNSERNQEAKNQVSVKKELGRRAQSDILDE